MPYTKFFPWHHCMNEVCLKASMLDGHMAFEPSNGVSQNIMVEKMSLSDQSRTGNALGYPTLLQDVTCPAFCANPKAIWLTCINPSNQMMVFKSYNNMFRLVRFECSNVKPYHVIPFHTMPYQWSSPVLTW